VLAEFGQGVVMPSIGALVPGHVLICPKTHHRSLVAAPRDTACDVEQLLTRTRQRLEAMTGMPAHVFEHGSSLDGWRVACSVEHAHIHLVPSAIDVREDISGVAIWQRVGKDLDDLRSMVGRDEYLFYEAPTGERLVATSASGFPSQALRRVIGRAIGVADWDWRSDPAVDRIAATADLLAEGVAA
jgi:diadenosine tetraphosphate (Ap4A) HIT family hydrolase